ncbi:1537_t:CDS:1, partial [Paraglomus occultum]
QYQSIDFRKASRLNVISDASTVLQLKFVPYDKFSQAGKTICEWILEKNGPGDQLAEYWTSSEVVELCKRWKAHAYLVIIVGSCKVLLWQLTDEGKLLGEPWMASE